MDYLEMDKHGCDWVRTEEGCAIDNSVGTLVWVRRRNGHWWPGRVLAAHEVPRSHLLVPKSGTPVKLLGKDDASVDWYNFDKSRRIKAFRCGEFDDCIERARSFGCLRSKNREKYARRDDAILHALELEKRQAEGIQSSGKSLSAAAILGPPDFHKQVAVKNELKGDDPDNGHVTSLDSRRCTFAQASQISIANDRLRVFTDFEMDNAVPEVNPRMRDLQDFGLQVANVKGSKNRYRNMSEARSIEDGIHTRNEGIVSCNSFPGASLTEDGNNKMESCITRLTAGVCSAPSVSKASLSIIQKRKKHPTGSSADESSYKKRDRRKPLTQVLKKSSNRVAIIGCESLGLPSSTADCQLRAYCSDGTEATSSQDAFHQTVDEFRPCSEHGDFDFKPSDHHISYGMKQEGSRPLTHSDTGLTSFWSNYWDNGRWPSLVSAHMDFGLLLGSSYADSIYKGTKSASCFPAVAYTGSATSVNTSNLHKSDSLKCLQENSNLSDPVGTETRNSKSTDCVLQEHVALHNMSRWQAKKRRNIRKSPHSVGIEHIQGSNICRKMSINEGQDPHSQHMHTGVSSHMRPFREKRLNGLVNKNLTLSTFQWVNVKVEFREENRNGGFELVSVFSEVMNRAILGYPVAVEVLRSRAGLCKGKPESANCMITTRVPRCPRPKFRNQSPERDHVRKARSKPRGRKLSRKSGSTLQKTRMLSSFASTDFAVGKENDGLRGSHGAVPSEVLKTPLVTCIPVHLVFQRIREVLYKQPEVFRKESCEEIAANGEA